VAHPGRASLDHRTRYDRHGAAAIVKRSAKRNPSIVDRELVAVHRDAVTVLIDDAPSAELHEDGVVIWRSTVDVAAIPQHLIASGGGGRGEPERTGTARRHAR